MDKTLPGKLLIIILLFNLLPRIPLLGQDISLKNIIPPSPQAAAFAKYGTYPVGHFTGKPDINIPVYEIKTQRLSLPITLSYDATGIRLTEKAGWAGLNWNVNAGGVISRTIIGEPDENGFMSRRPPRASDFNSNDQTYLDYLKAVVEGVNNVPVQDTGPDRYYYSFNGRSGSFTFSRELQVVQIPQTSLKIEATKDFLGFRITDESGVVYTFAQTEHILTLDGSQVGNPDALTGWYLTDIVSSDGKDRIKLSYSKDALYTRVEQFTETYGAKFSAGPVYQDVHEYHFTGLHRTIYAPRLDTITFSTGKVIFNRVKDRKDDNLDSPNDSRLDEIVIYKKEAGKSYGRLKSFKFVQGYYESARPASVNYPGNRFTYEEEDLYRLRLDTLWLMDSQGEKMANYAFTYDDTPLPPVLTRSIDWWGYYNGTHNSTLVPKSTYTIGNISIGGADRNPNEDFMKAGTLTGIKYPTGGRTVFDMEAHRYFGSKNVKSSEGGGASALGAKDRVHLDIDTVTTSSSLGTPDGSDGFYKYATVNVQFSPYNWGNVAADPYVKIKNLSTGDFIIFKSPNSLKYSDTLFTYQITPNTSYELTAFCDTENSTDMTFASVTMDYDTWTTVQESILAGGLRVKSVKNYGVNSSLANEEHYAYGKEESGFGEFVGNPSSIYSYSRPVTSYSPVTQLSCSSLSAWQNYYTGGIVIDQTLIQGSPVVYKHVVKYHGSPTGNAGKTAYYYGDPIYVQMAPAAQATTSGIFIINNTWRNGHLTRQQEFRRNEDATYTKVSEVVNTYHTEALIGTYGLLANSKFDRVDLGCGLSSMYQYDDYAFAEYPVYTGYVQLVRSESKHYHPETADSVQAVVSKSYASGHPDMVAKTAAVTSKGEFLETEYKYPFDKATLVGSLTAPEATALDSMVARNIVSPVIEDIRSKSGKQLSWQKTAYGLVDARNVAPVNVQLQLMAYPPEVRVRFTKYDSYGNTQEQSLSDNVVHVYLWGYNHTQPIAEIKNASYAEVEAALGGVQAVEALSGSMVLSQSQLDQLNRLRSQLPNAMVSIYTYVPLVGVGSVTDPNGRTSYYEYDTMGRLQAVKDEEGNVLKTLEYHYAGQ